MLRLSLGGHRQLCVDVTGGRGVYVHPRCVGRLSQTQALINRIFDSHLELDVEGTVRHEVLKALGEALERAAMSGAVVSGRRRISAALEQQMVCGVVLACDASPRRVMALRTQANQALPFTVVPFDKDELGRRIRRSRRFAVVVVASRSSVDLQRQLHRWMRLG